MDGEASHQGGKDFVKLLEVVQAVLNECLLGILPCKIAAKERQVASFEHDPCSRRSTSGHPGRRGGCVVTPGVSGQAGGFPSVASVRELKASPCRVLMIVLLMLIVVFPSLGSMLLCPNA